uniref:GG17315 n=1 Tax=Drosophila erecta TaxID=7220 RepID=B3P4N6_DROER
MEKLKSAENGKDKGWIAGLVGWLRCSVSLWPLPIFVYLVWQQQQKQQQQATGNITGPKRPTGNLS